MYEELEVASRLVNGLVTLVLAFYLLRFYRQSHRRFYLTWGIGFLLYGANILVRVGTVPTIGQWLPALLLMGGFLAIIMGIAQLVNLRRIIYVVFVLPLVMAGLYLSPTPENVMVEALGWIFSLLPYLLILLSLLYIQRRYSTNVDFQVIGWFSLLLANLSYFTHLMEPLLVDLVAIFAKILIFLGMLNPGFTSLIEDVKRYMISTSPQEYDLGRGGELVLVSSPPGNRSSSLRWITERVEENSRQGVSTIIVSVYDLLPQAELSELGLLEKAFLVRMIPGSGGAYKVMEDRVVTVDDDVNLLDLIFSDIIRYSVDSKNRCEIIIYTLSSLIHTHGWKRVYTFLTSKIPSIRFSQNLITCFYFPDSHESPADIIKFEVLADRIINLE